MEQFLRRVVISIAAAGLIILTAFNPLKRASVAVKDTPAYGYAPQSVSANDVKTTVSDNDEEEKSVSGNDIRKEDVSYTIVYKPNCPVNGMLISQDELMENQIVDFDTEINLSKNTYSFEHYEFVNWSTTADGLNAITYNDEVSVKNLANKGEIITLYAMWRPVKYKITYVLNGGINDSLNPSEYTYFDETVLLKNPARKGYSFAGWYKDISLQQKVTEIVKNSEGDLVFYAKWLDNTYSISFNPNGAKGSMSAVKNVAFGEDVKLPLCSYTLKDKMFAGWNTRADGKGTMYGDGATVSGLCETQGASITLYAQWKWQEYKITYKLDKGTNNKKNPAVYTVNTSTITFKAPVKTGFTFAGFYTDKKFKNKITKIKKGSRGDVTVYAKWTPNKYTIAFNKNGGKGSMSTMKNIKYNKSTKLKKCAFTKAGFAFAGWNTKKNGKGTAYTDAQKVKGLVSKNGGKITLYAQWKPLTYTVKFKSNGANSGSMKAMKNLEYGKSYKLAACTYLKNGYSFAGWSTQKNGKGTIIPNKGTIQNLTDKNGATVYLYARWRKKGSIGDDFTEQEMFDFFREEGMNSYGAAAIMGNLYAESGLDPKNLQNTYNESLHMTDDEYTDAVDDGSYDNFVNDAAGYGLAQWTSAGRKQSLLNYAWATGSSIGSQRMQLDFLMEELNDAYSGVLDVLCSAKSLKEASNEVLFHFERPRDQGLSVQKKREAYSRYFFKQYSGEEEEDDDESMKEEDCPFNAYVTTSLRIRTGPGTGYSVAGMCNRGDTYTIVHVKDGDGSSKGWGQIDNGSGWIALDYCTKVKE